MKLTRKQWIEGTRKLESAATYLDLQWTLNQPSDTRNFAQWWAGDAVGRASDFMHYLAANSTDHMPAQHELASRAEVR